MPQSIVRAPFSSLAKSRGGRQKRLIPRSEFPGQVLLFPTEGKLMKKVLFATTALVATASVAAADVTFGGYGRFGVLYSSAASGGRDAAGLPILDEDGREQPGLAKPYDDGTGDSSFDITSRFRLQIETRHYYKSFGTFSRGLVSPRSALFPNCKAPPGSHGAVSFFPFFFLYVRFRCSSGAACARGTDLRQ